MSQQNRTPAPPEVSSGRRPFAHAAQRGTAWAGTGAAAITVLCTGGAWVVVGALCSFPRWWELIGTVGVPFLALLMLVVVQHTQNHDDRAVQIKLDEILRALPDAAEHVIRVEEKGEADLTELQEHYRDASLRDGQRVPARPER